MTNIINMIKKITAIILSYLGALFGTWNMPPWFRYLFKKSHDISPRKRLIGFGVILFIIAAYSWHLFQPQPERITAQITIPSITPIDNILKPDVLRIEFGILLNDQLTDRPVAPLSQMGKTFTDNINITPTIPGKWHWQGDSKLVFTPAIDWPAGQTYTVSFERSLFTAGTHMAKWQYTFTTPAFKFQLLDFRLAQDPINHRFRQAAATIQFTHPVDEDSLKNHLNLYWQKPKSSINYHLRYVKNNRIVYLLSDALPFYQTGRYVELSLSPGIKPDRGKASQEKANVTFFAPDASHYFKIRDLNTNIVRNLKDQPEQILNIETSLGVSDANLTNALHVYALPKDYPANKMEEVKKDYAWQTPGEITPAILALAKPVSLEAIPPDHENAALHSYRYYLDTPSYLYITIDKGLHGSGDFDLANEYAAVLNVPVYPKEISFLHEGALLALGTEEKFSVMVRGLSAVKFEMGRILPNDINHLITQTSGTYSQPYFFNSSFNQNNITTISSDIQTFNSENAAQAQYTALDLKKYFNGNKQLGLFLLKATGWDPITKQVLNPEVNRLILITDLGLIVKDNQDGSHDVFVQSITHGTPVAKAKVDILGKNGLPIISQQTDAVGHASFPNLKDFINDREPVVYLVQHDHDLSFIPYNRYDITLNYSRFNTGGMTNNSDSQNTLSAYLFSDRGIYRPGDTAHVGVIVKQTNILPQPAGLPLLLTVTDPRGTTIKNQKITLNNNGFFTIDIPITASAQTGTYYVNISIVDDKNGNSLIGSTSFEIGAFLPDRLKINAELTKDTSLAWLSPNNLTAHIGLWNLYGAPAANHLIKTTMLLTPQQIKFDAFPDYIFYDPLLSTTSKSFKESLNDIKTNTEGQANLDLNLNRFTKATYQLTLYIQGFELEGGRSVTTKTNALVSPLPYFLGYKSDGNINYVKQHAARSVNLIAINPQLKKINLNGLTLTLYKLHPVSTLIKKEDGTYQYKSITQETKINTQAFSLEAGGNNYNLPTNDIGDYLIKITDQHQTELLKFNFGVVGASEQPLPKNATLSVKLNKTEYQPGDDIEMQITAPYAGAGLITIERNKVYAYKWFKADTNTSVQKIHLPADFQGNGYINVALVRDLNSPEIFINPLSYSVIPFSVSHQAHTIKVDLSVPTLALPGDTINVSYKTDQPSQILLFGVDEGILQITQYQAPDPLKFFFAKRALEVNTLQIVDQILPKFIASRELSSVGGDAGPYASTMFQQRQLNPFKRITEAPVVFWSPILDADSTQKTFSYHVPDYFNGSLHIFAVAVAANAVGSANQSTTVRGHFVINPNVPTFAAPGDEFDVNASVANNIEKSGTDAKVNIALQTNAALKIIGNATQTISIPEGQARSVHFKVRATSQLGNASLQFIASYDHFSTKLTSTLSVRPATTYRTQITSGYTNDSTLSLKINRVLYPAYRQVSVAVSSSPIILAAGIKQFLEAYPFGCTEQIVSQAFPLLGLVNQPWLSQDVKKMNDTIQKSIEILMQRQIADGSFNYWPEVGIMQYDPFPSVYAMHFLTEAKEDGYAIPSHLYNTGVAFLREFVTHNSTTLEEARVQAYAIYILTRNEIITTNAISHLQNILSQHPEWKWKQDITSAYLASSYQLLHENEEGSRMIQFYVPGKTEIEPGNFYNQSIGDAVYLYLISRHFPERMQQLNQQLVLSLVKSLNSDEMNTLLASYTILGLSADNSFVTSQENVMRSISEILSDDKEIKLASGNTPYQQAMLDDQAKSLMIQNTQNLGYFYQLTEAGFDQTLPTKLVSQGIEVYREYRDSNDKIVTSAALGDELTVHLRARTIDNKTHNQIVIVDLLPGGFEVVKNQSSDSSIDSPNIDAREDRVIFYTDLSPTSIDIVYHIKATNQGTFTIPPVYATSMYYPLIKSIGIASEIKVN